MHWLQAALWGIAGGFVVEGLELQALLKKHRKWPWHVRGPGVRASRNLYLVAETLRLLVGGILAAGAAASGLVSGALAAMAIGVAAPVMVERLTSFLPLPADSSSDNETGSDNTKALKTENSSKTTSVEIPPSTNGKKHPLPGESEVILSDPAIERGA